jgi:hypothetical protein
MYTSVLTAVAYGWARLHGVRAQRAFLRRAGRCAETQRRVLRRKLAWAAGTEYGRRHGFARIATPDDYRRAVPIVDYQAISPLVARVVAGERDILFPSRERLLMFAMTSGTTATPKYVPVTERYLAELAEGNFVWGMRLLRDHPAAIAHKILHIVSPSRESAAPSGIPCGAATGLVAESQRRIAHLKYALPPAVHGIGDYGLKYLCILRLALQKKISLLIAANPSTLVALGRRFEERAPALVRDLRDGVFHEANALPPASRAVVARHLRKDPAGARRLDRVLAANGKLLPRDAWPELAVIGCWTGGTLTPYLDLARAYWGDRPLRDPGLIASEGRMTIPLEDGDGGGVLDVGSHFYEFIPYGGEEAGATLLAHELEEGKSYFIILTTSSGFFRYNISDVVKVTGRFGNTPVLKFLHKGSRISSLTGEKITEHQVVEAFRECERSLGLAIPQFTVCPGWGDPPRYFILIEEPGGGLPPAGEGSRRWAEAGALFDLALKRANIEYRGKRDSGRLGMPAVRLVESGSFDRDKRAHVGRSGGRMEQYKHPYLSPRIDHCTRFRLSEPEDGRG